MKIRQLKAILIRRGFTPREGKGSHTIWTHPNFPARLIVLRGPDSDEAPPYQVARVCKGRGYYRHCCTISQFPLHGMKRAQSKH